MSWHSSAPDSVFVRGFWTKSPTSIHAPFPPLRIPRDYDPIARPYSPSPRREASHPLRLENVPTGVTPFSSKRVHQSPIILDRADPRLRALDPIHFPGERLSPLHLYHFSRGSPAPRTLCFLSIYLACVCPRISGVRSHSSPL